MSARVRARAPQRHALCRQRASESARRSWTISSSFARRCCSEAGAGGVAARTRRGVEAEVEVVAAAEGVAAALNETEGERVAAPLALAANAVVAAGADLD